MGRKKCPHVDTMNKTTCAAGQISRACPHSEATEAEAAGRAAASDPHCAVTDWSDWSPCSVSCGEISMTPPPVLRPRQTSTHCCHSIPVASFGIRHWHLPLLSSDQTGNQSLFLYNPLRFRPFVRQRDCCHMRIRALDHWTDGPEDHFWRPCAIITEALPPFRITWSWQVNG